MPSPEVIPFAFDAALVRVVLNEAVEVSMRFGSEQGHTYVNGVLDKLARAWRGVDYGAQSR